MKQTCTGGHLSRLTSTIKMLGRPRLGMSLVAGVLTAGMALLGGASANAWGPNRQTFTMQYPSTTVQFNSITDNPDWGDERGFTLITDVTDATQGKTADEIVKLAQDGRLASGNAGYDFGEKAIAKPGHVYMVKMLVHNNASANLDLVAKNTRAYINMPTASSSLDSDGKTTSLMMQGQISADNCGADKHGNSGSPCKIWDEAYLQTEASDKPQYFTANYVTGTARYWNNKHLFDSDNNTANGYQAASAALSDNIASPLGQNGNTSSAGALLGYDTMDGNIQGCFQYSGYVTFFIQIPNVAPATPSFSLYKQVRVLTDDMIKNNDTKTGWGYNINAQPGETVQYRVTFTNTGNTPLGINPNGNSDPSNGGNPNSAVIRDYMNSQLSYNTGSTWMYYMKKNQTGVAELQSVNQKDDSWVSKGLKIGGFTAGSNMQIEYTAQLPDEGSLFCGDNQFDNVVLGWGGKGGADGNGADSGAKLAQSIVTVHKDCVEKPPVPVEPPATTTDKCKYNDKLEANDPKCVAPGTPAAGLGGVKLVSLALLMVCAAVMVGLLMHKNRGISSRPRQPKK